MEVSERGAIGDCRIDSSLNADSFVPPNSNKMNAKRWPARSDDCHLDEAGGPSPMDQKNKVSISGYGLEELSLGTLG
jgi:hypothetical protein